VHHYTVDVEDFKNVVSEYHTTFGLPVVVSEFACSVGLSHLTRRE